MSARFLTAIGLLLTGCTEDFSVVILRNAPSESKCEADLGGSLNSFKGHGFLDVTYPLPDGRPNPGYTLTPVVQSGVAEVGRTNVGNPMSHLAIIEGADIDIVSDGTEASNRAVNALSGAGLASRTEYFTVVAGPGDLIGPHFQVIDTRQTQILSATLTGGDVTVVLTRTRIFGTLDGSDFDSHLFTYPVTVIKGGFLADAGSCDKYPMDTVFPKGGVCGPLQDGNLTCCEQGQITVCPAVGTMPKPMM